MSDGYLLGFAPCETPRANLRAGTTTCAGWWIRTSTTQAINGKSGLPIGFKHQLMHGGRTVTSGVGADMHRTFKAQALFLNARDCAPTNTFSITLSKPTTLSEYQPEPTTHTSCHQPRLN
jgi:hypothetical protein